ncbi:MAG: Ribosomal protein [Fibrobacterota bacterium]|jgi:large subunit ribosomal protein L29
MKTQKAADLRSLDAAALTEKLAEAKDALFQKKLQHSLGKLEDSASIREAKREIARLNTVITEKGNR